MNELPRGTVTFLFTDIEGSTKLWQQFPDAMPAALARHHEILNSAIQAHNGYVFQIIGDAFCAAFATAFDGLDAALDAQRTLHDDAWGKTGAIRVRMALHTGAAEVRAGEFTSGEYVSGITLSRAARLLSAGHGGQILLSSPSAELVREQLPQNIALRDMGAHRLKDLVQPQQIFQILANDLPQDFPALKTLDTLPNNLPIQLTSFVGREKEIAQIVDLLTADRRPQTAENESSVRRPSSVVRLLTLTGAGGSGKTRLSLQVAAEVIEEFEKGAWFVELAPIADASLAPNAVMSALELREDAGRAPLDALTDFLRAKKLLLILDNCEHLIDACAQLAHHLLKQCPNLKVLATSREALGVAGEVTYQVPPLGLPDLRTLTPVSLSQYDAVKLFIERAVSVQPNFTITNANAPAIAQICFRLDGIPLAIELAAARIKLFSPEQISARLDDRFRLLTSVSRTAMPRQQTLHAAIDWSYSLLSEQERVLFRRLAVFAGGWTFDAAEQVCTDDGEAIPESPSLKAFDILELLSHLVDKSLVVTEAQEQETRYRMLETIRKFSQEKLLQSGERENLQERHLQFYVNFTKEAALNLTRMDAVEWRKRLAPDHDNIRLAIECAGKSQNTQRELQLICAVQDFWLTCGYLVEGRERTVTALEHARAIKGTVLYANALCAAAWITSFQGDFGISQSFAEQALEIYRKHDDIRGIAETLKLLGVIAIDSKDYAKAEPLLEQALQLGSKSNQDTTGLLMNMGWAALGLGKYSLARERLEQVLNISLKDGYKLRASETLVGLAEVDLREGRYEAASNRIQTSLRMQKEIGDKWLIGVALGVSAWISVLEHDWNAAFSRLQASIEIRREIGDLGGLVWCLEKLGQVAFGRGSWVKAVKIFGAAASVRATMGSSMEPFDRVEYERSLESLHAELGQERFSAEWDAGSKLTLEQAIEFALGEETANS